MNIYLKGMPSCNSTTLSVSPGILFGNKPLLVSKILSKISVFFSGKPCTMYVDSSQFSSLSYHPPFSNCHKYDIYRFTYIEYIFTLAVPSKILFSIQKKVYFQ